MLDEALHAAQTLRQREQMAALEHAARALEPAAQYRGDDTAETTRHLSPGKRVLRASAATALRSTSFSSGLVGLSTHTSRVSGRMAPANAVGSDRSTNETRCPAERLRTFSSRR